MCCILVFITIQSSQTVFMKQTKNLFENFMRKIFILYIFFIVRFITIRFKSFYMFCLLSKYNYIIFGERIAESFKIFPTIPENKIVWNFSIVIDEVYIIISPYFIYVI